MKYIVLCLVLLFTVLNSSAQDTIFKRSNESVVAKIIEINSTEIKYKRADYIDGPTFVLKNWEIKYIKYANGVIESFENYSAIAPTENQLIPKNNLFIQPSGKYYYYQGIKITEPDMLAIVDKVNDKKINLMVNKTNDKKFIRKGFLYGAITLGAAGFFTSIGVINFSNSSSTSHTGRRARTLVSTGQRQTGDYLMLAAIACELVSITFRIQETRHAHITVDAYNNYVSH